jgi:hypothetical protein
MNVGQVIAKDGNRRLVYAGKNGRVNLANVQDGEKIWGPYPIASITARGMWTPVSDVRGWFDAV